MVAPVRERGLKYTDFFGNLPYVGRSREGAWIEIKFCPDASGRLTVAPVRERGLKYLCIVYGATSLRRRSREGAWIEIR